MPIIGAHIKTTGGIYNCFKKGEEIGAKAIQFFGASPRQWAARSPQESTIKKFKKEQKRTKIDFIFLHASYLVNLATSNEELFEKSVKNLSTHLKIAELLNAKGLIFHLGSNNNKMQGYKNLAEGIKEVLKNSPGKTKLIMENSSGGGSKIGLTPEEIGEIFKLIKSPRVKICIDTAHAFGAGILNKFSKEEIKKFTEKCEKSFGLKNITVLHINDSKVTFNSKKDRHENISRGFIKTQAYKNLAQNKHFNSLPWILEVPGFENNGPDKKNINILKSLIR